MTPLSEKFLLVASGQYFDSIVLLHAALAILCHETVTLLIYSLNSPALHRVSLPLLDAIFSLRLRLIADTQAGLTASLFLPARALGRY